MKKHMVVVSIDAFVYEDLEYARELPSFKRILDGASVIERVKTIYPSLTHPVHATVLTGAPAGVTGITSNMIFNPEDPTKRPAPWYNRLDEIKCDTLLHAAKRAGLSTAAACWPCTSGGGDVIDYLVPGILNYDLDTSELEPIDVYRELGATENVIGILETAISRFGARDEHPAIEELQAYCSAEIIRRYKPDLLLTHPSYVDNRRHAGGVYSDEVRLAIRETDRWLGMLISAAEDAGIYDDTDFILLSDHGHINIMRVISPNVYLADAGFIKVGESGELLSYDAYAKSGGASAHVYLKRPDDVKLYKEVYKLLSDMAKEGIYGFSEVLTADEVRAEYGLFGGFSFVLETDGYTSFGEHLVRPAVRGFSYDDYRYGRGTHGHRPEKGPQPVFIAKGPSFKTGVTLAEGSILNHAPTLAEALGVELRSSVGRAVSEILK